jgi:hypothetical protein
MMSMMSTLDPPFLELEYYVGPAELETTAHRLVDGLQPGIVPSALVMPKTVGLLSQKPEELVVRGGVVILRTEGLAFCGPFRDNRARLKKLGRRVYKRFVEVADAIPCVYGAILVEYSLEEPEKLRQYPRSLAFRDFFLNRERLENKAIEEAIRLAGDEAYVESRASGVYISMNAEFNPKGRSIPSPESQWRSERISAVIGRAAR